MYIVDTVSLWNPLTNFVILQSDTTSEQVKWWFLKDGFIVPRHIMTCGPYRLTIADHGPRPQSFFPLLLQACEVLAVLATTSEDFIRQRVVKDILPKLNDYLLKQARIRYLSLPPCKLILSAHIRKIPTAVR